MNSKFPSFWSGVAFILSTCSYLYELMLIQFASELTNNNFLVINLCLGTFILGLGMGLKDIPENLDKEESIRFLSNVEFHICLLAIISWLLIQGADFTQSHFNGLFKLDEINSPFLSSIINKHYFYILIATITSSLLIGYKSGQELPLILQITKNKDEKYTSLFFSLTYLGSVAASFGLNFFLKKYLVSSEILVLTISINLLVFIMIGDKIILNYLKSFFVLISMSSVIYLSPDIEQLVLKNHFHHFSSFNINHKDLDPIFQKETEYQKITIHNNLKGPVVSLNRQFQFSFLNESLYHDAIVHIPIQISDLKPKNALLLGGGDGLALRELLKINSIKSIKQIELDEEFTEFCRTNSEIKKINENSLDESTITKRIYGDAFFLIKKETEKFDFIVVDFPYPFSYDLWKLYSIEFYLSLKNKLSENGIIVIDAPIQNKKLSIFVKNDTAKEINSIIYSTVKKAGFKTIKLFSLQKEGFVILSNKKVSLDLNNITDLNLNEKTLKKIQSLKDEEFDYDYSDSFVNSIFKPTFFNFYREF